MPTELRHLLFRPPEVVQAVKEYHRRIGAPLPAGAVVRCGPEAEGARAAVRFRIVLTLDPVAVVGGDAAAVAAAAVAERQDVVIEGPALAAALILHCRDRRIPLPAAADKSLERYGEQVCLVVTINPKLDELPPADQLRL